MKTKTVLTVSWMVTFSRSEYQLRGVSSKITVKSDGVSLSSSGAGISV